MRRSSSSVKRVVVKAINKFKPRFQKQIAKSISPSFRGMSSGAKKALLRHILITTDQKIAKSKILDKSIKKALKVSRKMNGKSRKTKRSLRSRRH